MTEATVSIPIAKLKELADKIETALQIVRGMKDE